MMELVDNFEIALPLLEKFDLKATFFISTELIGNSGYMSKKMINELISRGHIIGGHGHSHLNYFNENKDEIFNDLKKCFSILQKDYGINDPWLSFPYGFYNNEIVELCRQVGFSKLFGSRFGSFHMLSDKEVIPRIEIWNSDGVLSIYRKINGKYNWLNRRWI